MHQVMLLVAGLLGEAMGPDADCATREAAQSALYVLAVAADDAAPFGPALAHPSPEARRRARQAQDDYLRLAAPTHFPQLGSLEMGLDDGHRLLCVETHAQFLRDQESMDYWQSEYELDRRMRVACQDFLRARMLAGLPRSRAQALLDGALAAETVRGQGPKALFYE